MDETAFRQARLATVQNPCPFEKALLAGCCACSQAVRRNIAEREAVGCLDAVACADCIALLDLLRRNAAFALHRLPADACLTHAQEMKVQCGGLTGLQRVTTGADEVTDVRALVLAARQAQGDLEGLPFSEIVQSMAAYQLRPRAKRS